MKSDKSFSISDKVQMHKNLLQDWALKYYDKEIGDNEFTFDGPPDWALWEEAKPKILFLVKESPNGYHPSIVPLEIKAQFLKNIARWRYALRKLYDKPNQTPNFPSDDLFSNPAHSFSDIAIVEVKKLDEKKGASSTTEIKKYARDDKMELLSQIDLLDPQIVLCCYTIESYDIIYDEAYEPYETISPIINNKFRCWKLNNRLVIDFNHPSIHPASQYKSKDLFDILCRMIKEGNVFDKFDWGAKTN